MSLALSQRISVTRAQAAELVGLSAYTIAEAVHAGQLVEYFPGGGGKALILVDDLRAWIANSPTSYREAVR